MDDSHALPSQVAQALARGWTVLTANQRAARTLRHEFDLYQRALGLASWQPPAILAWDSWLAALWRRLLLEGHATALLLNSTQEQAVWRELIERDLERASGEGGRTDAATVAASGPVDSLAELAVAAWHLLHAYSGRRRLPAAADTSDTRAFARWAAEFDRRALHANSLTEAQLPEALGEAFADRRLTAPAGLLLIGFDTRTPAQAALLETVRRAGAAAEEVQPQGLLGSALGSARGGIAQTLLTAATDQDELAACARWLRAQLTAEPSFRLVVITPNLDGERAEIDRVFRHILAPELEEIAAPTGSGPFEFSLGVPLAQTPLAATAFDILRWAIGPLPIDRISGLLLSPHFAPEARSGAVPIALPEHLARAEFDAQVLRRQHLLQPQLTLAQLLQLASHPRFTGRLPALLQHLRALAVQFRDPALATGQRSHAAWAATVNELLRAAGWNGGGPSDSIEFQTRERWERALDELATLDFDADTARVPFAAALATLERIAAQTLFAPESRHAPVQIMGPLESAGSTFDGVWFLRAGDLTWPVPSLTNPLLPWHLQRELGMPGASPTRDSALARRIAERIAVSAPAVFFSYAQQTPEGQQRPSPALASLRLKAHAVSDALPADPLPARVVLEVCDEDGMVPPPPDRVLPGGASILQAQAACGFRAFAEKRLHSTALDTRELGLDPMERGSLVHDVLERFWAEVKTQAALAAMAAADRDAELARAIDAALARYTARALPGWNTAYLDTERRRLLNLLRPWLDYELGRPAFAVLSREETRDDVPIGPLRLKVRVDRIDTALVEGEAAGEIILDYKTGVAKPADWMGDRPDAPQLPLYAVVSDPGSLAAVAFASVRPGSGAEIAGYEARRGVLPRPARLRAATLAAQIEEWRAVLTMLAEEFHAGRARVAPKQYPSTCRNCDQRLLCRLDLSTLEADAIEELADDSGEDVAGISDGSGSAKETVRG